MGRAPRRGPLTPQLKRSLDTRTKNVPYTIIFKLVQKFKLLHKSEVTVAHGTLLSVLVWGSGPAESSPGNPVVDRFFSHTSCNKLSFQLNVGIRSCIYIPCLSPSFILFTYQNNSQHSTRDVNTTFQHHGFCYDVLLSRIPTRLHP